MSKLSRLMMIGVSGSSLVLTTVSIAAAADSAPQCLRSEDIKSTKATDDSTLLFYMRNHKIWVNHLQSPCIGLTTDGFGYVAEPTDIICGNVETIRTLQMPSICKLGSFSPYTANP